MQFYATKTCDIEFSGKNYLNQSYLMHIVPDFSRKVCDIDFLLLVLKFFQSIYFYLGLKVKHFILTYFVLIASFGVCNIYQKYIKKLVDNYDILDQWGLYSGPVWIVLKSRILVQCRLYRILEFWTSVECVEI